MVSNVKVIAHLLEESGKNTNEMGQEGKKRIECQFIHP